MEHRKKDAILDLSDGIRSKIAEVMIVAVKAALLLRGRNGFADDEWQFIRNQILFRLQLEQDGDVWWEAVRQVTDYADNHENHLTEEPVTPWDEQIMSLVIDLLRREAYPLLSEEMQQNPGKEVVNLVINARHAYPKAIDVLTRVSTATVQLGELIARDATEMLEWANKSQV